MSGRHLYDVGVRFTVDETVPPHRHALHTALEKVRAVTVQAASVEEAEAQVDQIRSALEYLGSCLALPDDPNRGEVARRG